MPFLALPKDESLLRFSGQDVVLHYFVSTPNTPVFRYASTDADSLASSLRHPTLKSSTTSTSTSPSTEATATAAALDPDYPIILFLPSECFSVTHLFAWQLAHPTLSAAFNLIAVDPRGHGLTKDMPIRQDYGRKYDLDMKAGDCLDFVRLLLGFAPGEVVR